MNLFVDNGAGLVQSMAYFSHSIQQRKQGYNCEINDVGVMYNERMSHLCVCRHFLANRLHDKAAKLFLANSSEITLLTTTLIYVNSIHSMWYSFYLVC